MARSAGRERRRRLGRDITIALGERALAPEWLPERMRLLHRSLGIGAIVDLALEAAGPESGLDVERLTDVVTGAGFDQLATSADRSALKLRLRRARTLPDSVGPGMRLLVCGLNPSQYAADAGVPFARRGNRFWSAALAAGVVSVAYDPEHALRHHGVGMTDLVKRATPGADELTAEEYRRGLARVGRLCAWLSPSAVCFVGLAGWRAAVDRRAGPGLQRAGLSGRPVYVMPSTSGRNAHADPDSLRDDLLAALELSDLVAPGKDGVVGETALEL
ncbi:MAG TPA: mismatch-specific DNA-glycosylase [Acidimicrobiales bacterium]|nr:mismatch-specific DNA-glycosylase [Acidimicrobiales bacterium]